MGGAHLGSLERLDGACSPKHMIVGLLRFGTSTSAAVAAVVAVVGGGGGG